MDKRLIALSAGLLLLLTACSKPAATPPAQTPEPLTSPPPVAATPAPVKPKPVAEPLPPLRESDCVVQESGEKLPRGSAEAATPRLKGNLVVTTGTCVGYTYSSPVWVSFSLPPGVSSAAARQALKVTGAIAEATFQNNQFQVWLPEGKPGEKVTVRLTGPVGPEGTQADLGFELIRVPDPTVKVYFQVPGQELVPLTSGITLPPTAMELSFEPVGEPDIEQVRSQIDRALGGVPVRNSQERPGWLQATLSQPKPQLWFQFLYIPSASGLTTRDASAVLYMGEPPALVAHDAVTGNERTLAEVPPDISRGTVSPSGRWVALHALDPDHLYRYRAVVMDTHTGRSFPLTKPYHWMFGLSAFFTEEAAYLPDSFRMVRLDLKSGAEREVRSAARGWGKASPDGRYIVGYTPSWEKNERNLLPMTVVLYDTRTGKEQVFPDLVNRNRPHHDPVGLAHLWAPDGTLRLPDALEANENRVITKERTLRLDPATGKVTEVPEPFPPYKYDQWVTGPGGWAYDQSQGWSGDVTLKDGSGAVRVAGKGLPLGWRDDGRLLLIRWEHGRLTRYPPGP